MVEIVFERTNGRNDDFIENCKLLDQDLNLRVGKVIQRKKYDKYNQLDNIQQAIVVYHRGHPIGGGAIREYDSSSVELKRLFIHLDWQGNGLGTELVKRLIEWAKELGYKRMILETGAILYEACAIYIKLGFEVIPNYGPYVKMKESLCMGKDLEEDK